MFKQRSWGDCGVVALLNAIQENGISFYNRPGGYEEMILNLNGRDCGITIQEICSILYEHGFLPVHIPLEGFASASGIKNAKSSRLDMKAGLFNQWAKAIYQVKTKSGTLHFIYFDGYMIWDGATNSPVHPKFSDYESVIDAVYILPNTPFSIYRGAEELNAFSKSQLERIEKWEESIRNSNEKTAAQKIAEYEAARTITITNTVQEALEPQTGCFISYGRGPAPTRRWITDKGL